MFKFLSNDDEKRIWLKTKDKFIRKHGGNAWWKLKKNDIHHRIKDQIWQDENVSVILDKWQDFTLQENKK
jgi:hypothetical protein